MERLLRAFRLFYLGLTVILALAGSAAAVPIVIDFEADPLGPKPNGFQSVGAPGVHFVDTSGADLGIFDNPVECAGTHCLAVFDDFDNSQLRIDLDFLADSISMAFGNDELFGGAPVVDAALTVFLGGVQVGQTVAIPNLNDLMDQTISFSGATFDQAFFAYRAAGGGLATLIEGVDNIVINQVPEPAIGVLLGVGLGGLSLLRRRGRRR